jgi:hypothetical protein
MAYSYKHIIKKIPYKYLDTNFEKKYGRQFSDDNKPWYDLDTWTAISDWIEDIEKNLENVYDTVEDCVEKKYDKKELISKMRKMRYQLKNIKKLLIE